MKHETPKQRNITKTAKYNLKFHSIFFISKSKTIYLLFKKNYTNKTFGRLNAKTHFSRQNFNLDIEI